MSQEHLYKVLVIGDFGVGMTTAVALRLRELTNQNLRFTSYIHS